MARDAEAAASNDTKNQTAQVFGFMRRLPFGARVAFTKLASAQGQHFVFLECVQRSSTHRRVYNRRFLARPLGSFFFS